MGSMTITSPDGRAATLTFPDDAPQDAIVQKVGALKQTMMSQAPAPEDKPALSWSDVPGKAWDNLGSSAAQFGHNLAQPFVHPVDTLMGIGKMEYGLASKAGLVKPDAEAEYAANKTGQFFKDRYGSLEGIKNTLATDPVGAAADLSTVLTGGGTLAARGPGIAGKIGEIANTAASVVDPVATVGRLAKAAGKTAGAIVGTTTGAGTLPLEYAVKAGESANPAFLEHMRGQAPMTDVVDMARSGVRDMARERSANYKADMAQAITASAPANYRDILAAISDAQNDIYYGGVPKSQDAADILGKISNKVEEFRQSPDAYDVSHKRLAAHDIGAMDALKQAIGEIRQKTDQGTLERRIADKVYNATKTTIERQFPDYANVMKGYSNASENIDEATRALSLSDKASKDTALRKLTSSMRNNVNTNYGQRVKIVDQLAQTQPDLPYAIAGQALNASMPRGLGASTIGGSLLGGGLYAHNPVALLSLPLASPRLMGEAGYAIGLGKRGYRNALAAARLPPNTLAQLSRTVMPLSYVHGRVMNALYPNQQ